MDREELGIIRERVIEINFLLHVVSGLPFLQAGGPGSADTLVARKRVAACAA